MSVSGVPGKRGNQGNSRPRTDEQKRWTDAALLELLREMRNGANCVELAKRHGLSYSRMWKLKQKALDLEMAIVTRQRA